MQSCFHTYENVTCHTEIWRYDLEIWVTLVLKERNRGEKEFVFTIQAVLIRVPCCESVPHIVQRVERTSRFCICTVGSKGHHGGATGILTGSTCSNNGLVDYVPQTSGHGDTWPVVSTEGSAVRVCTTLHCVSLRQYRCRVPSAIVN